jgi:hypothetical protein
MKPSEFGGEDSTPAGLQPKGNDALDAQDRLKLIYRTGQSEDPEAPLDPKAFHGEVSSL